MIHVTAGEGDPYNEFANPNNQVSSHFGIGNGQGGMADGLIEQYVDTGYASWAQAAGNNNYLSVETEGMPTDPLTPAQVESFGKLMVWMQQTHGVPLIITDRPGNRGLITHGDGGLAWGGHLGCPGPIRSAQRADILSAATPPPPVPVPSLPVRNEAQMLARNTAGKGHWAVRPSGDVYAYGGAPYLGPAQHFLTTWGIGTATNPVVGIADDGAGGFVLEADTGVYPGQPTLYHITPGNPPPFAT